jgi:hypothetical protein
MSKVDGPDVEKFELIKTFKPPSNPDTLISLRIDSQRIGSVG